MNALTKSCFRALFAPLVVAVFGSLIFFGSACSSPPDDDETGQDAAYCEPNLTGTVDAADQVRDTFGIASYDYEFEADTHALVVDAITPGGDSLGTLRWETSRETLFNLDTGDDSISGSDVHMSFEFSATGERAEFEFRPDVEIDMGAKRMIYSTIYRVDGQELVVLTKFASDGSLLEATFNVKSSEVAQPPSTGFGFAGVYGIAFDPDNPDSDGLATWLDEVGRGDMLEQEAMRVLLAMNADGAWLGAGLEHVVDCMYSELEAQEHNQALRRRGQAIGHGRIQDCVAAAGLTAGTVGSGAGTIALCAAPDATITKVGCVAGFAATPALAYQTTDKWQECICGTGGANFANDCPSLQTCDPGACQAKCTKNEEEPCQGGVLWRGECVEQEPTLFGGDQRCKCIGEIGSAADVCDCEAGCSSGDPHLLSFDRLRYDFHGAGEFILAETTTSPEFEVQVRQEGSGSACGGVAVNTAVATSNGQSRVGLYLDQEPPVRVDGSPVELDEAGYALNDGLVRKLTDHRYVVQWASGEEIIINRSSRHLDLDVNLPPSRFEQVRGLLGTYNDHADDDLTTRDGEVLEQPVHWDDFYDKFGESWRISQDESLFDYADGEDTSDHTLRNYPERPVTLDDLPQEQVADAVSVCEDAGVPEGPLRDACVVDVACTGDAQFAASAGNVAEGEPMEIIEPLFLDGWLQQGEPNAGTWEVASDGRSVTQTTNGAPTFFLSTRDYFDTRIRGTFEVDTSGDDDFIGFVFGYQAPLEENGDAVDDFKTFVLSWKQGEQSDSGYLAEEGLTLAYADGVIDDTAPTFWGHEDTPEYKVLGTDYGEERGWEDYTQHAFELEYGADRMRIWIDDELIFDLTSEQAGMDFEPGRFGFYNYSQSAVIYSNFTVEEL